MRTTTVQRATITVAEAAAAVALQIGVARLLARATRSAKTSEEEQLAVPGQRPPSAEVASGPLT